MARDLSSRLRALRPTSRRDAALYAVAIAGLVIAYLADGLLLVLLVGLTVACGLVVDRRKRATGGAT